jgi:hypothetical protein
MSMPRSVGLAVTLSVSTAVCALAATISVNWDGCATTLGIASPILFTVATGLAISAIYFLHTRCKEVESRLKGLSIVLVSFVPATMALTLLGLSAANSGCG